MKIDDKELGHRIDAMGILAQKNGWKHRLLMKVSREYRHNFYLDELDSNLDKIDEPYKNIDWILKDGVWQQKQLSDLIVFYNSGRALPIELVELQRDSVDSAVQNLRDSIDFCVSIGHRCEYGKLIRFDKKGQYEYHKIKR